MVIFALIKTEFMSLSDHYICSHESTAKPFVKTGIRNVYSDLTKEEGKWENLNH